ncbi:MAG: NADPH-dependent assimilatory sulfite reductase hemoprotein subunit [Hyphomicrobium zavarzinii]|uniref:NADPH-dependent assimilatory sulfite reductase hemoprotein subunit n=1 Tax=Hyphomicrobium zavarzinii TaxID=48292 RepID=UPI001A4016D9|nr:NADPH-dependent assimilatory sulfite reductase hemoprotein subunit [Hyphomicrobium zavarzinii]MBL8846650.1 NADPH-dependent assimilatory sulfite reductase hemoprotein subunit [Hyphomicrobium zavarzinii]
MTDKRSKNEFLKEESHYLRGTIADGLSHVETGAIAEDDTQLIKFHGSYMQDHRDVRGERAKKKLEKAYSFMIRLRLPGGLVSPEQWLKLDDIAGNYANGTLRLTTRATFQYHGVIKSNLRRTMQAINDACLDTIAACGDVNRNVMCVANPFMSPVHAAAGDFARKVSDHLLPKTSAYHEIWLEGEKVSDMSRPAVPDTEPLYGVHYLPRKFKIVIAVPPHNDGDVFAHDLGFIAITDAKGALAGWNVSIGGGMGMTHGDTATFPRTGDVIGFCTPDQAIDVAEKVMLVQRDWGNRENRANARLKYTVERFGADAYRAEVEKRLGYKLGDARPFKFTSMGDPIGWHQGPDKKWHLGLFIENGRIKDTPDRHLRTALREIAQAGGITFSLTGNQNIIICNVGAKQKAKIEVTLKAHGIDIKTSSGLRRNSISCVALPTCALALAESERFLPELITTLEDSLDKAGLREDDIVIRMTGCPNGCGRPYMAEIGFVGRAPGLYNLYLGAAHEGTRLNKLYAQDVGKARIVELLEPLFLRYAKERQEGERFGDFVIRAGVVKATLGGNTFHSDVTLV